MYLTDLDQTQEFILVTLFGDRIPKFRKYTFVEIFNAIQYLLKTGCQWNMLPSDFPDWHIVYHHFRSWSEKDILADILLVLVEGRRGAIGDNPCPITGVIDSESVRSALPQSEKGIDGNKKVKGIKRHLITDIYGYPLDVYCTTANVHDSKGGRPLFKNISRRIPTLTELKADKAYRICPDQSDDLFSEINIICVKSNFGTSEFIPIDGRWVIERTFSWMSNYRRLTRNYEKLLVNARAIFLLGCISFMLRYFCQSRNRL